MPKSIFADRIGRARGRVYDLFNNPGCDTTLLRRISDVLECNFFKLLSDDFEPPLAGVIDPRAVYTPRPSKPPVRIVIEVDEGNVAAKAEAERMAARILEKGLTGAAPERDKPVHEKQKTPSRRRADRGKLVAME